MRSIVVAAGVALAVALSVPATAFATVAGTTPAKATASPEHPLFDVSCATPRYCVAVGYNETADGGDGGPLAETWNGRAWATAPVRLPAGTSGGALFAVSCASQKSCLAIGDYFLKNDNTGALAESWNGKTWTAARPPVPHGTASAALSGVSCVTSAHCVATGEYTRLNGTSAGLVETWTGRAWAAVSVGLPAGGVDGDLDGVSCVSAKSCVAVGSYDNAASDTVALSESWNGRTWTASKPPAPAGTIASALQGVSCLTPANCVGVGWYAKRDSGSFVLAEWWNGRKWTVAPLPKSGGYGTLYSVSCMSSKYCLAVGDAGAPSGSQGTPSSDVWNGRTWTAKKVPVPPKGNTKSALSMLQGVKCLSPTNCVAVGELDLGNGEQYQYGFSTFWNGATWRTTPTA
jgi:hypothetical protein